VEAQIALSGAAPESNQIKKITQKDG